MSHGCFNMRIKMPHWPLYTHNGLDFAESRNRTLQVLAQLNNPHKNLKNVIQITGTNGKGSIAKFVNQILQTLYFDTCLFTSPHIHYCTENILYNNNRVTDEQFFLYIEKIRICCETNSMILSFFETLTIAAILFFNEQKHDFCILEVGAGGLCDSTNVFTDNQLACIVNTIEYDHLDVLGSSISHIAAHKAGLINYSCEHVIIGEQIHHEVIRIINRRIEEFGIQNITQYDQNLHITEINKQIFEIQLNNTKYQIQNPSLNGFYQKKNAAVAFACCMSILGNTIMNTEKINDFFQVKHICRLEKISTNHENLEILLDGAHNKHGADSLVNFIQQAHSNKDIILVVARTFHQGHKNNIDFISSFQTLKPQIKYIMPTKANEVNAESESKITYASQLCGFQTIQMPNVEDCMDYIFKTKYNQPTLILICGSLYIRKNLHNYGLI